MYDYSFEIMRKKASYNIDIIYIDSLFDAVLQNIHNSNFKNKGKLSPALKMALSFKETERVNKIISHILLKDEQIEITECENIFMSSFDGDNSIYQVKSGTDKILSAFKLAISKELDVKQSPLWGKNIDDNVKFYDELMQSNFIYWFSNLLVNDNSLLFTYFSKNYNYLCMYDIAQNKTTIRKNPSITSENMSIRVLADRDRWYYSTVNAGQDKKI